MSEQIKLESGSGVKVGEKTLEEYLDEQAALEEANTAQQTFKDVAPTIFRRNYGKVKGTKQRYYNRTTTRIFTKQEIYLERKGVLLMEQANAGAPLSQLVIQCILDGKKKDVKGVIEEIKTNTSTKLVVNQGSVSSIFTRMKESDFGYLLTVHRIPDKKAQSIQVHKFAKNLTLADACLLYGKKDSFDIEAALVKYPEMAEIPKIKKLFSHKDKSVSQAILEIMLDCEKHTTIGIQKDLKAIFGKDVHANTIATQMGNFRKSGISKLIKKGKANKSKGYWHSFVFKKENGMDIDTLMNLYRKNNPLEIESLSQSHPVIWNIIADHREETEEVEETEETGDLLGDEKASDESIVVKAEEMAKIDIAKTYSDDPHTQGILKLVLDIVESAINDPVKRYIHEAVEQALKGLASPANKELSPIEGISLTKGYPVDVNVSGGININFSFSKYTKQE